MTWSLRWWPWALSHAVSPWHSPLLWAPSGFSSFWLTSIPVPALLASPITLTAGPLVAYNALMLAAVVLAAAAAYLLCWELTETASASVLGALVFGLSSYMLGHTLSQHLNLTFVFPLPLLALLVIRYSRGKVSSRRFVFAFAGLLLVLLGSSLELFADLVLVLCAVGLLAIVVDRNRRRMLARIASRVALAYAVCLPVLVLVAYFGLSVPHGAVGHAPADYSVDLVNLALPTPTVWLGAVGASARVTAHFVGNIGERDGYIGIPLLAVCVLALRSERRRGAVFAGLLLFVAVAFSLGPLLVADGRPLAGLPVSTADLPVVGNALPARMSVFASLAVSMLCALWFGRTRRRSVQLAAAVIVVASIVPNFAPSADVARAWARPTPFAWSTPSAPVGFVGQADWRRAVPRGANVLVLPTGDRTVAEWWQVLSGMRFVLTAPATPFTPPALADDPTVARLLDDVLPQLDGEALGAARLRAFLRARRVSDVVVTPSARRRWLRLVRAATGTRPVLLGRSLVFRVPVSLAPLAAHGELTLAWSGEPESREIAARQRAVRAWVAFDGVRGHIRVRVGAGRAITISSPTADADSPAVAADTHGRVIVAFTERTSHALLLRVATLTRSRWRVATLDRATTPIWSERVTITPDGTVVAGWIVEVGASRSLRFATFVHGRWQPSIQLDHGDGLGSFRLFPAEPDTAVVKWHDSVAMEARHLTALYTHRAWQSATIVTAATG